jgi:hypothetical protein
LRGEGQRASFSGRTQEDARNEDLQRLAVATDDIDTEIEKIIVPEDEAAEFVVAGTALAVLGFLLQLSSLA